MYVNFACVICDESVIVAESVLAETPHAAAICDECDQQVPWSIVYIIWKLRCQMALLLQQ
jgi:transcription elongation factor Elf1